MREVDVLVVGGGPAGLLTAAYLAERHRVAVIERGALGHTTKFWITTERRLQKNGLDDCVLYKTSKMIAGTFLGGHSSCHGDFAVVDDQRLLQALISRCNERGVLLLENCSLTGLVWRKDRIEAKTTGDTFLTRLVGDASGAMSPVASTFRLHRIDGFYAVYGGLLQNIKLHSTDVVLAYVSELGDPPPIWEVIPAGADSAFCVLLIYSKALTAPHSLAASFKNHCDRNPFFDMTPQTQCVAEKAGALAVGKTTGRRLPGVISLGEAGLIQPPLMSTAFNEVLEYTQYISKRISESLDRTNGLAEPPHQLYPLLKRAQDKLQLSVAKMMINGNVEFLDKTIRTMNVFPDRWVFNFFSNELTWPQLLQMSIRLPWQLMISRSSLQAS